MGFFGVNHSSICFNTVFVEFGNSRIAAILFTWIQLFDKTQNSDREHLHDNDDEQIGVPREVLRAWKSRSYDQMAELLVHMIVFTNRLVNLWWSAHYSTTPGLWVWLRDSQPLTLLLLNRVEFTSSSIIYYKILGSD